MCARNEKRGQVVRQVDILEDMEQQSLFEQTRSSSVDEAKSGSFENDTEKKEEEQIFRPLADRMRPQSLEEYFGQRQLVAKGSLLSTMMERDTIPSMILWGPPGVGKTTLARIIARQTNSTFVSLSAVTSGVKELRQIMNEAEERRQNGKRTILFLDEIHRFNKAQQDAFPRSTASTKPSRTPSCPMWKRAVWF